MNIDTRSRRAGKCFKDKVVFAHGEKMVTIRVNVCVSEAAGKIRSAHKALIESEKALKGEPLNGELQEQYGGAVLNVFAAVLGTDGVTQALDVYGNDVGDFVRDVKRYVFGRAIPKICKLDEKRFRKENGSGLWRWRNA